MILHTLFLFLSIAFYGLEKDELEASFKAIYMQTNDFDRLQQNEIFKSNLKKYISSDPFEADLEGLMLFSRLEHKKNFRIFNWNVPLENKNHFECLFALQEGKDRFKIIECKATKRPIQKVHNRIMSHNDWLPALYFNIIELDKKSKQYVLLGWDGNDELTNRKIIEIIQIGGNTIRFGAHKFKETKKSIKRHIIEYGEEAIVSINFDEKFNRIVFDHLSPSRPDLEGQYQFYVPDMTFDAYVIKKGELHLRENIKFLREKQESDRDFFDPRQ